MQHLPHHAVQHELGDPKSPVGLKKCLPYLLNPCGTAALLPPTPPSLQTINCLYEEGVGGRRKGKQIIRRRYSFCLFFKGNPQCKGFPLNPLPRNFPNEMKAQGGRNGNH